MICLLVMVDDSRLSLVSLVRVCPFLLSSALPLFLVSFCGPSRVGDDHCCGCDFPLQDSGSLLPHSFDRVLIPRFSHVTQGASSSLFFPFPLLFGWSSVLRGRRLRLFCLFCQAFTSSFFHFWRGFIFGFSFFFHYSQA